MRGYIYCFLFGIFSVFVFEEEDDDLEKVVRFLKRVVRFGYYLGGDVKKRKVELILNINNFDVSVKKCNSLFFDNVVYFN